jgi:hypothetical protein
MPDRYVRKENLQWVICVVSMRRILQVHTNITERYARQGMMAASARHLGAEEPRLASKLDCPFTKPHATSLQ